MGISQVPAASGSAVKSVQRGSAGGAGNVTITAVDINKSFVNVFGTTSSGTVSASFGLNSTNFNLVGTGRQRDTNFYGQQWAPVNRNGTVAGSTPGNDTRYNGWWNQTLSVNAPTVNAGSNNLVAGVVTGFLANSTTLTVSGACRWEVVEFN